MSLDVKFLREIDQAVQVRKPTSMLCPDLDARMLQRINDYPTDHSQAYLKAGYIKYFFKVKQNYVDEHHRGD